ncbi:uridine kinase family protein [Membranihabitans maritimus]|uniref:uridine kinase family protein n=1 Tax=Membranihabitans maritimus TaxID=2904244 RepID=UPI001F38C955|nr:uridine kinase [Membranihabitans maritimus]
MKSWIIGISGGSGSGKSVFLEDLKNSFAEEEVCFVSQDNYYKRREVQKEDRNGIKNFDLPFSIQLDEFTDDLRKLQRGETVSRNEYTFNNPKAKSRELKFVPAPVIVAEGLFLFSHAPVWDILDLSIFINATDSQRLSRRIIRDQMERNYPLKDVLYRYEHHVFPAYKAYIEPYYDKVDMVINNTTRYDSGLDVVKLYIKQKIKDSSGSK